MSASGGSAVWRRYFSSSASRPSAAPKRSVSIQPPCPTPSESFTRQMPREVSRKKVGGTRCVHGVGLFSRLR